MIARWPGRIALKDTSPAQSREKPGDGQLTRSIHDAWLKVTFVDRLDDRYSDATIRKPSATQKKKGLGEFRQVLDLLARPAWFEHATYGFVVLETPLL